MQQRTQRQLTAARVAAILKACIIPALGPNKLPIVGRGNGYTRPDGTRVVIFNAQAFASAEQANIAMEAYKAGARLEKAGDVYGAQEHYKNALNAMMSFNVTEDRAAEFQSAFEVVCKVELVDKRDGTGQILGINYPKVAEVATSGQSMAHLFELDEETKEALGETAHEPETEVSGAAAPTNRSRRRLS